METIDIVIRISKDLYKGIKHRNGELETEYVCDELMKAVDNGIELIIGHGRLGDIDFEIKHYESILDNPTPDVTCYDKKNAPVILKALRMIGPMVPADRGDDNG